MHIKLVMMTLTALSGVIPNINASPNASLFETDFDPIGPFVENNNDYSISGSYKSFVNISGVVEKLNVYLRDGTKVYTENKVRHDVVSKSKYNLTFTLPLKSLLNKDGINCSIQLFNSSNEPIYDFASFNLKPISKEKITVKNYLNEAYTIDDIVVDPDHYENAHQESFLFDGFIDYFNVDSYYRIDLNDLYLTYNSPKPFPISHGSLTFIDFNKLFPYLDNNKPLPEFNIPIVATERYGKIHFSFEEIMYVNPRTLEMSFTARPGFELTRYFYLPINKCQDLMNQVFILKMSNFGHGKISFNWNMRYTNTRYLIGDCSNSDYCVVGEVA